MSLHMSRKEQSEGNSELSILIASVIPALNRPLHVIL